MQLDRSSSGRLNVRADRTTYVVFGLISLPLCLPPLEVMYGYLVYRRIAIPSDLAVLILFPRFILSLFKWISGFQILVSDSEMSYRTLLGGIRTLSLSQIESVKTELGVGKLLGPFHRLVITPKHNVAPIIINMKVFSRSDLEKLFALFGDRVVGKPRYSLITKKNEQLKSCPFEK